MTSFFPDYDILNFERFVDNVKEMITATVLAKNSEASIGATLESLRSFDEVILYDTGSIDRTIEIGKNFPNVKIFKESMHPEGFGKTHNIVSALAKNDWILSIDSDEVLSEALIKEILSTPLNPNVVYEIDRHNYFNGKLIKRCSGWYPDPVIRLYNRKKTHFSDDRVHEKVITKGLQIIQLQNPILHTPFRELSAFLRKMDHYSTLFAEQNKGKKKSSLLLAIFHALSSFWKSYALKGGFLSGAEGFIISSYNGHTTFYKYLKLAEANKKHHTQ